MANLSSGLGIQCSHVVPQRGIGGVVRHNRRFQWLPLWLRAKEYNFRKSFLPRFVSQEFKT
jgi:hypothetical protein